MDDNALQPGHMQLFAVVMTSRTLSEAAERLHISQPAVTKAVRAMEARSGLALFDRSHARLEPTQAAVQLLPHVQRALAGIRATQRVAQQLQRAGSHHLTIAATTTSLSALVPAAVQSLRQRWPDSVVEVVAETTPGRVLDLVRHDEVRIGVAQVPSNEIEPPSAQTLAHREVCEDALSVIVPASHPLARLSRVRAEDLRDQQLIRGLRSENSFRDLVEEAFREARVPLKLVAEAASSLAICALVRAGAGVGIASPMQLDGGLFEGLVARPLSPGIRMKTSAYWRRDAQLAAIEDSFVSGLVELGGARERAGNRR